MTDKTLKDHVRKCGDVMKGVVVMSRKVFLVDEYGNELCELKRNDYGFYQMPYDTVLFAEGDKLEVVSREVEDD